VVAQRQHGRLSSADTYPLEHGRFALACYWSHFYLSQVHAVIKSSRCEQVWGR